MKKIAKLLTLLSLSLPLLGACQQERTYTKIESDTLYVKKVDNITDSFIMGMDSSAVPSLEDGGMKFYNFKGEEEDVFKILSDNGVNYIRVRVWNDPYDKNGNAYGGGNNDINRAVEIGKRATKYNMKLLVDFHYSDFWADPAKQRAPKAWQDMSLFEKQDALYEFTLDSMNKFKSAGVNVGMVQLGNETNNGMAGEKRFDYYVSLINKGGEAVKKVYPNALLAVHFANPEKTDTYDYYASQLAKFEANYDVFGTSYYPYWHGTLENLSNVLTNISDKYNKKVMVLETSYCFSEKDYDFGGNTIGSNGGYDYPFSIAGQANHVRNVAQTVANIKNGIGICYWEGTWIAASNYDAKKAEDPSTAEEYATQKWTINSEKWEKYGSGWAATPAGEYDPDVAEFGIGGTQVDNQTFFDSTGHPLESLKVFNLVRFGNEVETYVDGIEDAYITHYTDETFTLPATVNVIMSDNSKNPIPVTWEPFDIQAAKDAGNGKHDIKGTAQGKEVHCYLTLLEYNFLKNFGFEDSEVVGQDASGKDIYGATHWNVINKSTAEFGENYQAEPRTPAQSANPQTDKFSFHFWAKNNDTLNFEVEQEAELTVAGTYKFQISIMGSATPDAVIYIYAKTNGVVVKQQSGSITGYENWSDILLTDIEYKAGDKLVVGFHIESAIGDTWGDVDDCMLNLVKAA